MCMHHTAVLVGYVRRDGSFRVLPGPVPEPLVTAMLVVLREVRTGGCSVVKMLPVGFVGNLRMGGRKVQPEKSRLFER
jgi:hypothetical protein